MEKTCQKKKVPWRGGSSPGSHNFFSKRPAELLTAFPVETPASRFRNNVRSGEIQRLTCVTHCASRPFSIIVVNTNHRIQLTILSTTARASVLCELLCLLPFFANSSRLYRLLNLPSAGPAVHRIPNQSPRCITTTSTPHKTDPTYTTSSCLPPASRPSSPSPLSSPWDSSSSSCPALSTRSTTRCWSSPHTSSRRCRTGSAADARIRTTLLRAAALPYLTWEDFSPVSLLLWVLVRYESHRPTPIQKGTILN